MQFTENFQIPCLDENDYAGVALYMKCLAEKADAEYTPLTEEIEFGENRPTALWENLAPSAISGSAFVTATSVFFNGSNAPNGGTTTTSVDPFFFNFPDNLPGLWQVGAYVSMPDPGLAGEVTLVLRTHSIMAGGTSSFVLGNLVHFWTDQATDSSTGAMQLLIAAPAFVAYPDTKITVLMNLSAGMSVTPTAIRVWATYLSADDQIEVI